jgi:hypothetical protein
VSMVLGTKNTQAVGEQGNGSGDGRWIFVGRNGMGGGGEEFAEANRESAAHREQVPRVLSSSSLHPNSESSSSCFTSNSSPSSQLRSSRHCGVNKVGCCSASLLQNSVLFVQSQSVGSYHVYQVNPSLPWCYSP